MALRIVAEELSVYAYSPLKEWVEREQWEKIEGLADRLRQRGACGFELNLDPVPHRVPEAVKRLSRKGRVFLSTRYRKRFVSWTSLQDPFWINGLFPHEPLFWEVLAQSQRKVVAFVPRPEEPASVRPVLTRMEEKGIPLERVIWDPVCYPSHKEPEGLARLLRWVQAYPQCSFLFALSNWGAGQPYKERCRRAWEALDRLRPQLPQEGTYWAILPCLAP